MFQSDVRDMRADVQTAEHPHQNEHLVSKQELKTQPLEGASSVSQRFGLLAASCSLNNHPLSNADSSV